jgi:PAS domain S-box-containing protein
MAAPTDEGRDSGEVDRRLLLALDSVGDGVWDWDMVTDKVYYSPGWKAMLGYGPADIADTLDEWRRVTMPEDVERVLATVRRHVATGEPYSSEFRARCKDGSVKWVHARGKVVSRDGAGRPLRMIGLNSDITARKRSEESLIESEARFRAMFETSGSGMALVDLAGRPIRCNSALQQLLGYSEEELLRMTFTEFTHPEDRALDWGLYQELMEGKRTSYQMDKRYLTKDGRVIAASIVVSVVRDPQGAPRYAVGMVQDVTQRNQAEAAVRHSEELLRLFVRHTPAAVAMFDREVRYILASDRWRTDYHLDGRELTGRSHYEVFPDLPEEWRRIHQRCLAGESIACTEDPFPRADGSLEWLAWAVHPWRDASGKIGGLIMFTQVITDRKHIEDQLRALNVDLEQRVVARTADLRAAHLAAEAANRAKSSFLANMSHEIRTPMNAVLGLSYLALRTELGPLQRDYLEKIQAGAQGLLGVLNDVLDFSKIEAGHLTLESVSFELERVIESALGVVSLKAEEKGIELLVSLGPDVPGVLVGDPLRLGQVLMNLLSNAVKFTERGEVVLGVTLVGRHSDRATLQFSVRDTGVGIPADQQQRIFDAFTQADGSTTRRFGGSGLGLAISRQLVQLMNGVLTVTSIAGQGSTFTFTADLGMREAGATLVPRAKVPPSRVRVMVVDDNPSARQILAVYLRELGFAVSSVDSGEAALEALRSGRRRYDVVLLDWRMPGADGLEVAARLRSELDPEILPTIIMVTAYGREEIRQRAEAAGIAGFLLKPVSRSSLLDAIMTALGTVGASRPALPEGEHGLLTGRRVVLAEDNEINQLVAQGILEGWGMKVEIARDGREAVALLGNGQRYDGVLMDLQMPGMDGYQATRLIRSTGHSPGLPIIAMTADAFESERQRCFEAGMDDHVSKPIDPDHLYRVLVRWLAA